MHLSFHRNIGNTDRIIRITVGVIMSAAALFNPFSWSGWISIVIGIIGAAMIIEGALRY
ncbi:MAG: DUF2892 domain-containing protein [Syntrophomonadaceae bacterium]|nr:DUF2892 domain-containing protein [Syntrophomonadaceae bacterium]